MLKAIFSRQASKIIEKLIKKDPKISRLLSKKINDLLINPIPLTSKKLVNKPYYRVRVGNYRIVYAYDNHHLNILIIEKRDKVYKNS